MSSAPYRSLLMVTLPGLVLVTAGGWLLRSSGQPARTQAAPQQAATQPRAVVVEEWHDLGIMNPGDRRRHKFAVRNEGTAELTLELASTSCKCTLAELTDVRIAPGGSYEVELEWHAERPQFHFRQGATIRTNDPKLPTFDLVGEGSVRTKLGTLPENAFLSDVSRTTEGKLTLLLFSQAYSELEIKRLESSSPEITAVVAAEPAESNSIPEVRYQRDLTVTLRPQAKAGRYEATIRVEYVGRLPDGTTVPGEFTLPAAFEVGGDFSLHGRDVIGKLLSLGMVSQQTGTTRQAYVHVRGEKLDDFRLSVKLVRPEFLKVRLGEPQRLTPLLMRYPVIVEVPAGVPPQTYHDDALGEIELATNFADRPSLRFPVAFVVVP